jgi:LysR family transcriptional regulator, regulator for genes of the gallate degradation pathway
MRNPDDGSFNLRHLRALEATCRLGSINLAASALHMSQPGITQAIAGLEMQFAARLLSRHSTGSSPTDQGSILVGRIERFFEQLSAAIVQFTGRAPGRDAATRDAILTRLTFAQLRALLALSRHGALYAAAADEGLSVSTLHRAARDLESNLGLPLYVKRSTGLGVTPAGKELARRFQLALAEIAQAREEIANHAGATTGVIRIGTLPMIRSAILGRAITATLEQRPGLRIEVLEGAYELMLGALRGGDCDILLGALRQPAPAKDVTEDALFADPYAIVARHGHPLTQRAVTLADLAACEWLTQRPGTPVYQAFTALFADSATPPRVGIETSSLVLSRSLLMTSNRLMLLSKRQIVVDEAAGLLASISYPVPAVARQIGVTRRLNWLPSPGHQSFLRNLTQSAAEDLGVTPPDGVGTRPALHLPHKFSF